MVESLGIIILNGNNSRKSVEDYLEEFDEFIKIRSKINKVNGMDADDIAQELRMLLLKCYDMYDETKNIQFNTYYITACNYTLYRLKHYGYRGQALSLDTPLPTSTYSNKNGIIRGTDFLELLEDEKQDVHNNYIMDKVYEELDKVPDGNLVKLYYLERMKTKDIADLIGYSTQTVFNKINKALDKIRKNLNL